MGPPVNDEKMYTKKNDHFFKPHDPAWRPVDPIINSNSCAGETLPMYFTMGMGKERFTRVPFNPKSQVLDEERCHKKPYLSQAINNGQMVKQSSRIRSASRQSTFRVYW